MTHRLKQNSLMEGLTEYCKHAKGQNNFVLPFWPSVTCLHAGAHPTDVRMTTRFKENDLTEGLTGAIHETGHSLYEQVCCIFTKHFPPLFFPFSFFLFLSFFLFPHTGLPVSKPYQWEYTNVKAYYAGHNSAPCITPAAIHLSSS